VLDNLLNSTNDISFQQPVVQVSDLHVVGMHTEHDVFVMQNVNFGLVLLC